MQVEVVTIERLVYSGEADMVLAPGAEGQLGILPHHAPLVARLSPGELVIRREGAEEAFAIGGGFIEVLADRVVVLADTAEPAAEIDVRRAEAARERALELLRQRQSRIEAIQAEAALRRSLVRLRVARRRAPRSVRHSDDGIGDD
ncbi:MAG: F0F1 ATP synthase subunit epsilon [Anaerolineae bacterium]|nr:F0F1 ATP synthase subunit epsilon [Anaerolineae bacterium]